MCLSLGTIAAHADAIVVGWTSGRETKLQRRLFRSGLFGSGRAVVVVPGECKVAARAKRVIIAWEATRGSARALHDAMPLLQRMEAVQVLAVDDHETDVIVNG